MQHQQERLAALQPEPVKEATLVDSLSSTAASVSESVSGFFRSLFYRAAVACLPCWELLSALRDHSYMTSAKFVDRCTPSLSVRKLYWYTVENYATYLT